MVSSFAPSSSARHRSVLYDSILGIVCRRGATGIDFRFRFAEFCDLEGEGFVRTLHEIVESDSADDSSSEWRTKLSAPSEETEGRRRLGTLRDSRTGEPDLHRVDVDAIGRRSLIEDRVENGLNVGN